MSTNAVDLTQSLLSTAEYENAQKKKRLEAPVGGQPVAQQPVQPEFDAQAHLTDFLKVKSRESSFIEGVAGTAGRDNWVDLVNSPYRTDLGKDLHEVDIAYSIDHQAVANNVKDFTEKYGAEVGMQYMRIAYTNPAMSRKAFEAQAQKFWYEQIDKQKQDNAGMLSQLAGSVADPGAFAVDAGLGMATGGVGYLAKGAKVVSASERTGLISRTAAKVTDAVKTVVDNPKFSTAMSVAGAAKRGAMEAVPGTLLQEMYLQSTQYTREGNDALPNILMGIAGSAALSAGAKIIQKGGHSLVNMRKVEEALNNPAKVVENHAKTSQAMNGFENAPEAGQVVAVRAGGDEHPTVVLDMQPHAVTVYDPVTHKTMTVDHADVHAPTAEQKADAMSSLADVAEQVKQAKTKAFEVAQVEAATKDQSSVDPLVDAKVGQAATPDGVAPMVPSQVTDPSVAPMMDQLFPTEAEIGKAVIDLVKSNEPRKAEPKTRRAKKVTSQTPAVQSKAETPQVKAGINATGEPKVGDVVSFTMKSVTGQQVTYKGTVQSTGDKLIVKTDEMHMPVSRESIQKVEPSAKTAAAPADGPTVFDRAAEDTAGSDLGRLASVSPASAALDNALHGRFDEANSILEACARS